MASCNTTVFKRKTVTKSSTNEKMHCLLDSCRKKNLSVGDRGGGGTWLRGPPLGADGEARAAPQDCTGIPTSESVRGQTAMAASSTGWPPILWLTFRLTRHTSPNLLSKMSPLAPSPGGVCPAREGLCFLRL